MSDVFDQRRRLLRLLRLLSRLLDRAGLPWIDVAIALISALAGLIWAAKTGDHRGIGSVPLPVDAPLKPGGLPVGLIAKPDGQRLAKRRTVCRSRRNVREIAEIDRPSSRNCRMAVCRSRVRCTIRVSGRSATGSLRGSVGTKPCDPSELASSSGGHGSVSSARWRITVASRASARLCHRCHRSATRMA
jgi:hypothetical protein